MYCTWAICFPLSRAAVVGVGGGGRGLATRPRGARKLPKTSHPIKREGNHHRPHRPHHFPPNRLTPSLLAASSPPRLHRPATAPTRSTPPPPSLRWVLLGFDGAAATAHGVAVEAANTAVDAVQEVAAVGGAGDAAPAVAGSVAAAADLVEQGVVGSDSVVPDLLVTASGGALDAGAEASDKQVVDVVILLVPLLS